MYDQLNALSLCTGDRSLSASGHLSKLSTQSFSCGVVSTQWVTTEGELSQTTHSTMQRHSSSGRNWKMPCSGSAPSKCSQTTSAASYPCTVQHWKAQWKLTLGSLSTAQCRCENLHRNWLTVAYTALLWPRVGLGALTHPTDLDW